MTHRWAIRDSNGQFVRDSDGFDSRPEAEQWLKNHWEDLIDEGGSSVVLKADGEVVYEMGLEPE